MIVYFPTQWKEQFSCGAIGLHSMLDQEQGITDRQNWTEIFPIILVQVLDIPNISDRDLLAMVRGSLTRGWKRTIHGYYQYIFISMWISCLSLFYIDGSVTWPKINHGTCSKCNTCRWRCNGCNCINARSTLWSPSHRVHRWYCFRSWFQIYSGNLKRFSKRIIHD